MVRPGDVAGETRGPAGTERCAGYPDCPRWHDVSTLRWLLAVMGKVLRVWLPVAHEMIPRAASFTLNGHTFKNTRAT